jgi:hypothetical protein
MNVNHPSIRAAALVSAIAIVLLISPVMAGGKKDPNRPVVITFTKWALPSPSGAMAGFVGGDPANVAFVGHLFAGNFSFNGHVGRVEAMYEVIDGDRSFSAMLRGGQNAAGAALLDGFILDGWRIGAPVHAEFQRMLSADGGCAGAPDNVTLCWEGFIVVRPAPKR